MSRRLFGAVAAAGITLVSWGALGQPRSSSVPAVGKPANLMAPVFRPGIAPAPKGSAGKYELRYLRSRALFTDRGMELSLPSRTQESRTLGWSVAGGRPVLPQAEKPREAKLHRLVGARESWQKELPTYGGLRYPGVLPGVELWFEERAEGVKYGFRAERGADLKRVELEYAGAREVRVVDGGRALEVDLGEGVLREEGLRCEQQGADGVMREVGCRFTGARPVGQARWAYAIAVDVADPDRPVVVDPVILWNTYFGGSSDYDGLQAIQQDNKTGDLLIVGTVSAAPVSSAEIGTFLGSRGLGDAFVARFKASGELVWWTLFGGAQFDAAEALVIGAAGELYVAGLTNSDSFDWSAPDGRVGSSKGLGGTDGFVAMLDSSGRTLEWFARVGGDHADGILTLIPGPGGRMFAGGVTLSSNIQGNSVPLSDLEGFVVRIDPGLPQKVEWTRLIRSTGNQQVLGLAYKDDGSLYATGTSLYADRIPLDAFISRLSGADGLAPSTPSISIFGGNGDDEGIAVSLPPAGVSGDVVVWGTTYSDTFEDIKVQGGSDMFAAVFEESDGVWSKPRPVLFGGPGVDVLSVMTTDPSNRIYLGGTTKSRQLPFDKGFDATLEDNGLGDGFVARVRLEPGFAIQWEWGSFVGGTGQDEVLALQVDSQNPARLYFGGSTNSDDLKYSNSGFDTSPDAPGMRPFLMAADMVASPPAPPDSTPVLLSPLGWSCGSSVTSGGPGAFSLGALAGLALLVSRRRPRA